MKSVLFFFLTLNCWAQSLPSQPQQLLVNPDFALPLVNGLPPGWFKASVNLDAPEFSMDVEEDDRGRYLVLKQEVLQKNIFNNWAQRIESPPLGKRVKLVTEVATEQTQGKGAVVLLMFFDQSGRIAGAASSENQVKLTGTKPWQTIVLEAEVPPEAQLGMVRFGLSDTGTIKIHDARLYLLEDEQPVEKELHAAPAGLELIQNGSFDQGMILGLPLGWFKAMNPARAIHLDAGMETMEGCGQVIYIKQDGVTAPVINNWAQRLETVPLGATVSLSVAIKTKDLPYNTGFVMLQCWDKNDKLIATNSTQSIPLIGGTEDWRNVCFQMDIPEETESIIVRCGLTKSGQIWFDNVSLVIVSEPEPKQPNQQPEDRRGFPVTEESLAQLKRVQELADELAQLSTERLGPQSRVRREVFAMPDGTFETVIYLNLEGEQ